MLRFNEISRERKIKTWQADSLNLFCPLAPACRQTWYMSQMSQMSKNGAGVNIFKSVQILYTNIPSEIQNTPSRYNISNIKYTIYTIWNTKYIIPTSNYTVPNTRYTISNTLYQKSLPRLVLREMMVFSVNLYFCHYWTVDSLLCSLSQVNSYVRCLM